MFTGYLPNVAQFFNSTTVGSPEVEVRFGRFNGQAFVSNVRYHQFERLEQRLRAIPLAYSTQMSTIEIDNNSNRRIRMDDNIIYENKIRHHNIDLPEYNIRMSLSQESPIAEIVNFQPQITRERIRRSYTYNDFIRVDCTEICTTRNQQTTVTYEVEVEFLGVANQLELFNQELTTIYKYFLGTANLYSQPQIENLLLRINQGLGVVGNYFDRRILVNARNLHRRDMVYGGIVGNPETRYLVTYKADGYRKLLVIHSDGIWLIYPPYEFNLVIASTERLQKMLTILSGTVLDGELVHSNTHSYYFLAFDILTTINMETQQIMDVRNYPYITEKSNSRQALTAKIVQILDRNIGQNPLLLEVKPASLLTDVPTYFREVRYYLEQRLSLPYPEDGLIFLPADTSYNPGSDQLPLFKRILTQAPDICKWKPGVKITNDFALRWLPNNELQLQVLDPKVKATDPKSKGWVPFSGTRINRLDPSIIDSSDPLLRSGCGPLASGTIVEFEYDGAIPILRPLKVRHDKSGPNQLEIAQDNWDMAFNPIDESELAGNSLRMAFTYHNQIKRQLFSQPGDNQTLLDIGSGRGGDLSKWLKYRQIVAVEPNPVNAAELRLRLQRMTSLRDRVYLVETGGEDTATITRAVRQFIGGQVDVVSSMLSLSFFWQSAKMLQMLANTIKDNLKPDGTFLFLTIDGRSLDNLFTIENTTNLQIGPAKFNLVNRDNQDYGQTVDVILPDTIVEEQREYLVFMDNLTALLEGYQLKQYESAIGENLLSDSDLLFSSLYSYGYYLGNTQTPGYESTTKALSQLSLQDTSALQQSIPSTIQQPIPSTIQQPIPSAIPSTIQQPIPSTIQQPIPSTIQQPIPSAVQQPIPSAVQQPIPSASLRQVSIPGQVSLSGGPSMYINPGAVCLPVSGNVLSILPPVDGGEIYEPVQASWYQNLVRIATIGDNNCFMHALLLGFASNYQKLATISQRRNMAAEVRRDLAAMLGMIDNTYTKYTVWEVSARGQYINLLLSELENPALVRELQVDYSLKGLRYYLNSRSQLGEEFVDLCSRSLRVNIYLLRATVDDLHVHVQTHPIVKDYPHVVLIGGGCHWELLGLQQDNNITTSFMSDSPFINTLQQLFNSCGEPQESPYDPKANYFRIFRELNYKPEFLYTLSQLTDDEPLIQRLRLLNIVQRNAQGQFERTAFDVKTLV